MMAFQAYHLIRAALYIPATRFFVLNPQLLRSDCLESVKGRHYRMMSVLYFTVLYFTVLYCTVLYCTILYCTVLYCTVLYCTVLYCTILSYTILYYTILYYTILYYTILYYTILYYTTPILRSLHRSLFPSSLSIQVLPFILRRTKASVAADLPTKTIVDVSCPLSHVQRRMYADFQKGLIIQILNLNFYYFSCSSIIAFISFALILH